MSKFKELAIELSDVLAISDNPIEQKLNNLGNRNRAELHIYNLLYGWFYIQDNNLAEMKEENAEFYFGIVYNNTLLFVPNLEAGEFFQIYLDRFQMFQEELHKVRKMQATFHPYLPIKFYNRVLYYPLENKEISTYKKVENGSLTEEYDFIQLFVDYNNFLNKQIKKII